MSLFGGDFTTAKRFATWAASAPAIPSPLISQLITSMSVLIRGKLNRGHLFSRNVTDVLDGVGNYQLLLPAYPLTNVISIQMGAAIIQPSPLPNPTTGVIPPPNFGYGYRFIPWDGVLPGQASMLEFINGIWWRGSQNIKVTYTAGYLISNEAATVPATGPFIVTVQQPDGIWCRDNGVTYANGTALVAGTATAKGVYVPPTDQTLGEYTFDQTDASAGVLISYSYVPADLEEATNQMVAERLSYRGRIGEEMKTLGGQESVKYLRGYTGRAHASVMGLPPEVADLIWPYVSTIPPIIGAPV